MSTFQDVEEHLEEVVRSGREALGHLEGFQRSEVQFGVMGSAQRARVIQAQKDLHEGCAVCQNFDGSHREDPQPDDE